MDPEQCYILYPEQQRKRLLWGAALDWLKVKGVETRLELHKSAPIISPSMLQLAPEQLLKICLLFSTLLLHQYKMELLRSNKRSTSTKNLNITDTELPLAVPLKICSSRSQRKWLTVRRFSMFLSQKQIKSSYTQKHGNDHVYFWSL